MKIELVPEALATERLALEWVGAHRGPVPSVRAASHVRLSDGRRAACLVTDRADGCAPESAEAWRRMGRALAGLSELPWEGSGLTIYDADTFGQAHRRPVSELEGPLREAMTDIEDFDRLTSLRVPSRSPLVLTHGDPGPGNFLDDGRTGTLIDWEEAQVAPRGLDLARAMFIALLGSGPSGFVARNSNARSRSVATGYLTGLRDGWEPASSELRWWLTVAGVQFAHRRRERAGQPGVRPFTEAIAVFAGALRDNGAWMPG